MLTSFNERDTELSSTISTLQQLITGLKDDRERADRLARRHRGRSPARRRACSTTSGPPSTADIKELRRADRRRSAPRRPAATLDRTLKILPIKIDRIGRTGQYGSFFNFYVCDIGVNGKVPVA